MYETYKVTISYTAAYKTIYQNCTLLSYVLCHSNKLRLLSEDMEGKGRDDRVEDICVNSYFRWIISCRKPLRKCGVLTKDDKEGRQSYRKNNDISEVFPPYCTIVGISDSTIRFFSA